MLNAVVVNLKVSFPVFSDDAKLRARGSSPILKTVTTARGPKVVPLNRLKTIELLANPPVYRTLERARRVFVNRNLRMDQIDLIGFDMDYTLALYKKDRIEELAFRLTVEKLIKNKGYPSTVAKIQYDSKFAMRGLVIDKKLGNVLKMDRHRHVGKVYHGRRPVSKDDRTQIYRNTKIQPSAARYHLVDTLFTLPEVSLFAELVDWKDRGEIPHDHEKIFDDIRVSIDEAHRDGSLKAVILANLAHYVDDDPDLAMTLHKFRSSGKRLFLMTNSYWDYTDAVMKFLLEKRMAEYPTWRAFFDIVIVGAEKPGFFTGEKAFADITDGTTRHAKGPFEKGRVYLHGNLADFEKFSGQGGDRILYVGDHIYGDILRSKKSSTWRTAMVVQDLEEEIVTFQKCEEEFRTLGELETERQRCDYELNYYQMVLKSLQKFQEQHKNELADEEEAALEEAKRRARANLDRFRHRMRVAVEQSDSLDDSLDERFNPYWGLIFKEGNENSSFAEQVEDYACIYTSRVSNFLWYSPLQYFRSPRDSMPHERP
ncbi:MAG: HAD-IG family 5'-nucleotidase [Deltaproteobacteria bacterium]|nr:HAD-IG family 5'-nucleotidase [Deltaproteobacteria bacterium]